MRTTNNAAPLLDVGAFMLTRLPTTGCQEPNCRADHQAICAAALDGHKKGQTCGRRMCWHHTCLRSDATGVQGPLCSPHARRSHAAKAKEGTS